MCRAQTPDSQSSCTFTAAAAIAIDKDTRTGPWLFRDNARPQVYQFLSLGGFLLLLVVSPGKGGGG